MDRVGTEKRGALAGKVGLSVLVLGLLGTLAGIGTFAAFSSTTENTGNTFVAGSVTLGDNDSSGVLYNVSAQVPGVDTVKCIKLTFTGTLASNVRLYTTSTVNASAQYINLTIDKGTSDTSTFPNCGTYTPEGAPIYSGTLSNFASTKSSYANGVSAYPGSQTQWNENNTLVYRFTLSLVNDNNAQGADSGSHLFRFEAQNQ